MKTREQIREYSRKYRSTHLGQHRHWERDYRRRLKAKVLAAYGHECACCGEFRAQFLTLDHKHNDGNVHRRALGNPSKLYTDVIRRGFPKSLQLLCFNCNMAKAHFGECPHVGELRGKFES